MEKYIKKIKKLDTKFKIAFNTDHSFIIQYHDIYKHDFIINGINYELPNWLDIMQDLLRDFNSIVDEISKSKNMKCEKVVNDIIKLLISKQVSN